MCIWLIIGVTIAAAFVSYWFAMNREPEPKPIEPIAAHALEIAKERHDGTSASLIEEYAKAFAEVVAAKAP